MSFFCTSEQARQIDQQTISRFGISSAQLMKRAGEKIYQRVVEDYPSAKNILFLIGPGNNGGDGMIIAQSLRAQGKNTVILKEDGQLDLIYKKWDLIVDAVFGFGLNKNIEGFWQNVFLELNAKSNAPVVAVDIASGLDGTTGDVRGVALKADQTYSLVCLKIGQLINWGPRYSGRISVLDIGTPKSLLIELCGRQTVFTEKLALKLLFKEESPLINKSRRGHCLIIGGSKGYWGALELSAMMAARAGAGYVSVSSFDSLPEVFQNHPDFLMRKADEKGEFISTLPKVTSLIIGPGLGKDNRIKKLLKMIQTRLPLIPAVIDADALGFLPTPPLPENWVLTPHAGEMARMMQSDSTSIESKRYFYAKSAQVRFSSTVLLKGFRTVVCSETRDFLIFSGHPSLAKAGTGDVLSGMIGGLMAQGYDVQTASCLGAYLHGKLGEYFAAKYDHSFSLLASDLRFLFPEMLKHLKEKHYA